MVRCDPPFPARCIWTRVGTRLTLRIEETFIPWLKQTVETMTPLLAPVREDFVPYESTDLPPPLYKLRPAADHHSLSSELNGLHLNGGIDAHSAPVRNEDNEVHAGNGHGNVNDNDNDKETGKSWTKPRDWVWAKLTRNRRVTGEQWWQDVREIELEFEDEKT
jgi:hypothetical protein